MTAPARLADHHLPGGRPGPAVSRRRAFIGCYSVDGTRLADGPDRALPELLPWLAAANQPTLCPPARPLKEPVAMASRPIVWTVEQIRALGAATNLATAAAVLGIGRTLAYELVATNRFPVPVIRAGTRVIVPVAPLLKLLHADDPDTTTPAHGRLDRGAVSSVDATTDPADSPRPRLRAGPEHNGGQR